MAGVFYKLKHFINNINFINKNKIQILLTSILLISCIPINKYYCTYDSVCYKIPFKKLEDPVSWFLGDLILRIT